MQQNPYTQFLDFDISVQMSRAIHRPRLFSSTQSQRAER